MSLFDAFKRPNVTIIRDGGSTPLVEGLTTERLYETQANLRAVVSFIADSIADVPLKVYARDGDTDRRRVTDSAAALLLKHPNSSMTQYEFIARVVSDICLHGECLVALAKDPTVPAGYQLLVPPHSWLTTRKGSSAWEASAYVFSTGSTQIEIAASDLIVFRSYNPDGLREGLSPVSALKQTLIEQIEADRFRRQLWKRGGRFNVFITRPKDVEPWSEESSSKWREAFKAAWTGKGAETGGIPVLEDGMDIKQVPFNAREAQWYEAAQLSREQVAAAYHVNPAMIWHTGTQTYASAKDNARALYADTLSPVMTMIEQRINAFLLPKVGADENEYVEFDRKKKLQGSFEEEASVLQTSVGAPWMTRNEARARQNLPAIEGGDELITPLNVMAGLNENSYTCQTCDGCTDVKQGGCDDWHRTVAEYDDGGLAEKLAAAPVSIKAKPDKKAMESFERIYTRFFERQKNSVLPKIGASKSAEPTWFDLDRWTKELAEDLEDATVDYCSVEARAVFRVLGIDPDEYSVPLTVAYLRKMLKARAKACNQTVMQLLEQALNDGEEPSAVYEKVPGKSETWASALACGVASFALHEGVNQATSRGARYKQVTKTWRVNSANPRSSHAAINGETVEYGGTFSNGAKWPQDASLPADEACNCQCTMDVEVTF